MVEGLLSFLKTPQGQGLLATGAGYLANASRTTPVNSVGRGMLTGLLGYGQAQDRQERLAENAQQKQLRDLQMQTGTLGLEKTRRDMAQEQAIQDAAKQSMVSPEQANAMSMGPMPDGSFLPQVQPGFNQSSFLQSLKGIAPLKAMEFEQTMRKANAPVTVAAGASLVDPTTNRPVYTAPDKPAALPSGIQEYKFAQGQGYQGTFEQFDRDRKKAGATTLNMDNLGLKPKDRFEMEDKLRADYTKATSSDQEIVSTAADIKNILAQPGALKDQAAIYKFAKALDPQGAVREADYAAIVKTAGGLEYLTNLANKALNGEQLSPGQRKQMTDVTESMARIAKQRIAKQQQTYGGRAKMYNLTPENVFSTQSGGNEWAIVPPGGR